MNGLLLNNDKDSNMGEFQMHLAKWKRMNFKGYTLSDSIYIKTW